VRRGAHFVHTAPRAQLAAGVELQVVDPLLFGRHAQAIEGTVITAAAAPGWISWANLGSGAHTARALSASITRAGIW